MCPSNCYMVVLLASQRAYFVEWVYSMLCVDVYNTGWVGNDGSLWGGCVGWLVGWSVSWLDSLSIGFLDTQCKWEVTAWCAAQGGASDTFYQLCEIWVYLRVQCVYTIHIYVYTNTMTTQSATTKTTISHIYI